MNKKLLCTLIALICLALVSTGCWDRIEVEQLAIVRSIAIDYLPGRKAPYLVTLAISLPSDIAGGEGGGGGEPTQLFSGVGATINLALEQANFNLSRRLFLSHAELFIVSEELGRHGLTHVLDFIVRHPQVRLNAFLLVTPGMAQKCLTAPERLEAGVTEEIIGMIHQAQTSPESDPQQAFKFLRQMASPGQDPYISILMLSDPLTTVIPELKDELKPGGQEESSGGGSGESGGSGGGGGGEEQEQVLTLVGQAAFQDDKLVGLMNGVETRGFLWFMGRTERAVITVSDPEDPDGIVSTHVARVETTIKPQIKNGQVSFTVQVEEEGDIRSVSSQTNLATTEMIPKINSAKAAVIKHEMEKALRKMQELKTDLVGFGAILNRKDPDMFRQLQENWSEEFSKLTVDIVVISEIRRTGQQSGPVQQHR
ncbi:MAG: Ger(x)C family spore germination protein [Firmicutes bacterium]|nr:Ger(x)C family spore germination protein [Bacillota bacterium]